MLVAYILLLIILIISVIILAITLNSTSASADALWGFLVVYSGIILAVSMVGLIFASKTGKVYRDEYDKIIQNIDSDKTKVIEENDEITDIYITVNGQDYHFEFKEKINNDT